MFSWQLFINISGDVSTRFRHFFCRKKKLGILHGMGVTIS